MPRNLFTLSTTPVPSPPDPLLLFIQRAQLAIYYDERRSSGRAQASHDPVPGD